MEVLLDLTTGEFAQTSTPTSTEDRSLREFREEMGEQAQVNR